MEHDAHARFVDDRPERIVIGCAGALPLIGPHRHQDQLGAALDAPLRLLTGLADIGERDDRRREDAVLVVEPPLVMHPVIVGIQHRIGGIRLIEEADRSDHVADEQDAGAHVPTVELCHSGCGLNHVCRLGDVHVDLGLALLHRAQPFVQFARSRNAAVLEQMIGADLHLARTDIHGEIAISAVLKLMPQSFFVFSER